MPPTGSNTTGISGNRASIAWTITWANCKGRRSDMDAGTSIDAEERERELVITRIFDAPRHLVFQAWTEPDRAARWWGPQGFVTTYCNMDVRPGGVFRVCMRSPAEGADVMQRVHRRGVCLGRPVFPLALGGAGGEPRTP